MRQRDRAQLARQSEATIPPVVRARDIAWRQTRGETLSASDREFVAWAELFWADVIERCRYCGKRCHDTREGAEHHAAHLILRSVEDPEARGRLIEPYLCPDGGGWHVGHAYSRPNPPHVEGQRPSDRFRAWVQLAREVKQAEGIAQTPQQRELVAWAMGWTQVRASVHPCRACGKLHHTTAVGAAQHACYEILSRGAGRFRLFQCRRGGSGLHIGR